MLSGSGSKRLEADEVAVCVPKLIQGAADSQAAANKGEKQDFFKLLRRRDQYWSTTSDTIFPSTTGGPGRPAVVANSPFQGLLEQICDLRLAAG